MSKSIKKLLTVALTTLATFAFVTFGVMSINANKAYAADPVDFGILNTAEFRTPGSEEDSTKYGIRFTGTVSKAKFDANKEEGTTVYGIQITTSDLGEAGAKDVSSQTLMVTFDGDVGTFKGSIVNLQEENYTRQFKARAYYQIGANDRVYSDWSDAKNIFTMSTQALHGELSGDKETKVNEIINAVTDTAKNGHYYVKDFALNQTENLANDAELTVTATMTNGKNTLTVYPTMAVTSPTGITLVNGSSTNKVVQKEGDASTYAMAFNMPTSFKAVLTVGNVSETIDCTMAGNSYKASAEGNKVTLNAGSNIQRDKTVTADKSGQVIDGEGSTYKGEFRSDYSFYGLGEYKAGETLNFYFTGKNIPNVALFTDSNNGQVVGGGKGFYIASSNSDVATYDSRLFWSGPYRMDAGSVEYYDSYASNDLAMKFQPTNGREHNETGNKSKLGFELMEDGVNYRYTIVTAQTGADDYTAKLKLVKVETNEVVYDYSVSGKGAAGKTYAIAYGADTVTTDGVVTFSYDKVEAQTDNITLLKGTVTTQSPYATNLSYKSYQIGLGETLKVTFTGKNIPNAVAMSTTEGGQFYAPELDGYAFAVSQAGGNASKRVMASGPNRAALDGNAMLGRGEPHGQRVDSKGNNADAISYDDLVAGTVYTLEIYATASAVTYKVSTASGVVRQIDLALNQSYDMKLFENGDERYWVMLYGNNIADTVLDKVEIVSPWIAVNNKNFSTVFSDKGGYYYLEEDIDATGVTFTKIALNGMLDGRGHTISNLTHATSSGSLFNDISGGTVMNLALSEADTVNASQAGILCNILKNAKIINVAVKIDDWYGDLTGALARWNQGGNTLKNVVIYMNATNNTKVTTGNVGFISGFASQGVSNNLENCYVITRDGILPTGVRGGAVVGAPNKHGNSNDSTYYAINWSADTAAGITLSSSAEDTKYSNFLKGEFTIYSAADIATAYEAFKADDTKVIDAEFKAIIEKAGLVVGN